MLLATCVLQSEVEHGELLSAGGSLLEQQQLLATAVQGQSTEGRATTSGGDGVLQRPGAFVVQNKIIWHTNKCEQQKTLWYMYMLNLLVHWMYM